MALSTAHLLSSDSSHGRRILDGEKNGKRHSLFLCLSACLFDGWTEDDNSHARARTRMKKGRKSERAVLPCHARPGRRSGDRRCSAHSQGRPRRGRYVHAHVLSLPQSWIWVRRVDGCHEPGSSLHAWERRHTIQKDDLTWSPKGLSRACCTVYVAMEAAPPVGTNILKRSNSVGYRQDQGEIGSCSRAPFSKLAASPRERSSERSLRGVR